MLSCIAVCALVKTPKLSIICSVLVTLPNTKLLYQYSNSNTFVTCADLQPVYCSYCSYNQHATGRPDIPSSTWIHSTIITAARYIASFDFLAAKFNGLITNLNFSLLSHSQNIFFSNSFSH